MNKETGDIIQVMCRWRAAESVREYNHITPDVYADKVAAAMAVDASQAPKGPRQVVTDDDDAMAVLQAEMEHSARRARRARLAPSATIRRGTRGQRRRRTRGVPEHSTKRPAKNAMVLVPASIYPTEPATRTMGKGGLPRWSPAAGGGATML